MKTTKETIFSYTFSQKELKHLLVIEGDITQINLLSGLSPHNEDKGKSHDSDIYEIRTKKKEVEK
jgi:hypothetical protein